MQAKKLILATVSTLGICTLGIVLAQRTKFISYIGLGTEISAQQATQEKAVGDQLQVELPENAVATDGSVAIYAALTYKRRRKKTNKEKPVVRKTP